jgi:ligand-binding SRPBCC domain-containing protein
MKYVHRFRVSSPLEAVVQFHRQSASMGAITPPPIVVTVHRAPPLLAEGDEMDFTLWLGPFPIHWLARIEQVSPTSFVDRQLRGPFTRWVHRHTFVPLADGATEVLDEVEADLSPQWFWRLLGLGMWLNLPVLFTFRAWKTQRLLGIRQADPVTALPFKD